MPTKKSEDKKIPTEETTTEKINTSKIVEDCCKSSSSSAMPIIAIVIICFLLNAIFSAYMINGLTNNSSDSNNFINKIIGKNNENINDIVKKAINEWEMEKVWWEENYKILQKIYQSPTYKSQQSQSIKAYAAQLNITTDDTNTWTLNLSGTEDSWNKNSNFENSGKLTSDEIKSLLSDVYISWDENSKLVWIEYSDVECPYCKKFHQQGTVKQALEKYKWEISYTFKHFPLSFHKNAFSWSLLLECVGEMGGKDKFFTFMDQAYASEASDQDTLLWFASELWLDKEKLSECVASQKYKEKINANQSEGQTKFGINWTPGNLLLNKETWDWVVVSWAQPLENFESAISYLLWK